MRPDSSMRLAEGDHVVHFYDAEPDLVGLVVSYLAASVLEGDAVIVIATPEHRTSFGQALREAGLDPALVQHAGQLTMLDADETAARFLVDGWPDAVAFDEVVGALVRQAAATGRPVRAYGEMVARMWARGDGPAAVELERLWNELGARTPLGLFCAYPRSLVDQEASLLFGEICGLHSRVVAGAPSPRGAESVRRFVATPAAAKLARQHVAETLSTWGLDPFRDDALMVVAELAANAIEHAGGDFTLGLSRAAGSIRISVGDPHPAPPEARVHPGLASRGRGLSIVGSTSAAWGWEVLDSGKIVWAALEAAPLPAPAR